MRDNAHTPSVGTNGRSGRSLTTLSDLRIKLFADGADLDSMIEMRANPLIQGFTTNPTHMRKSGVSDYRAFARAVLQAIPDRPISFEVLSDDFEVMHRQAIELAGWGPNVFVKIPITDTHGASSADLLRRLAGEGVRINVTAILTLDQVELSAEAVSASPAAVISVFAGRIADTGRDPVPLMAQALEILKPYSGMELLWASPRELLNIFQADEIGCQIITATTDILKKLDLVGKDLTSFSLETVEMFVRDAQLAGLEL
jgi:transaldolase